MLVFPLSRQNAFDVFLDSQIHFLKGRLFYILTYPEFVVSMTQFILALQKTIKAVQGPSPVFQCLQVFSACRTASFGNGNALEI